LWSFILVNVVLNVATTKDSTGNSFYGLAIGGTVFVGAVMGGHISGACFNPAVGAGMYFVFFVLPVAGLAAVSQGGLDIKSPIWIYIVAPLIGGCMAACYFRITNYKEYMYLAHNTSSHAF
jgi:aquaporin Z